MVSPENPIELYRCTGCKRLVNDRDLLKRGACVCGSREVRGGSPGSIFEKILILWWILKLK